jgi:hypothetical protein
MSISVPRRRPAPVRKLRKLPPLSPAIPSKTTGLDVAIAGAAFLLTTIVWLAIDTVVPALLKSLLPDSITALADKPTTSIGFLCKLLPFALLAATATTLAIFIVRLLRWIGIEDGSLEDRIKKFVHKEEPRRKGDASREKEAPLDRRLLPAAALSTALAATVVLTIKAIDPDPVSLAFKVKQPEPVVLDMKAPLSMPLSVPVSIAAGKEPVQLTVAASATGNLDLPVAVAVKAPSTPVQVEVAASAPRKLEMELAPTVRQPVGVTLDVTGLQKHADELDSRLRLLERASMNLVRSMYAGREDVARLQESAIARASMEPRQAPCTEAQFAGLKELADDQLRREVEYLNLGVSSPETNRERLLAFLRGHCSQHPPRPLAGTLQTSVPAPAAATTATGRP